MFIFFYLLYNTDIIIKIKMQCVDDTSSSSPFLLLLIHVSWKNDLWSLDQIRPTCRSTLCVKMGHIALCCENRIFSRELSSARGSRNWNSSSCSCSDIFEIIHWEHFPYTKYSRLWNNANVGIHRARIVTNSQFEL